MEENNDLAAFYIITENDDFGESAHGPYTMAEAESLLQIDEKIITRKHYQTLSRKSTSPDNNRESSSPNPFHDKMLRQIRSWGLLLLLLGVIQIFSGDFLSNTWGILLIFVAISSFYFRSPAMFVIYGSTLAWAAISNAFSGSTGWMGFSLLQAFFSFQTFRQYFLYRPTLPVSPNKSIDHTEDESLPVDKAAKSFPWLSFLFGSISLVGFVAILVAIVIYIGITESSELPSYLGFIEGLVIDFAVIGFAAGLASLLSRYPYKIFSIMGMITGALSLLIEIGFFFIS